MRNQGIMKGWGRGKWVALGLFGQLGVIALVITSAGAQSPSASRGNECPGQAPECPYIGENAENCLQPVGEAICNKKTKQWECHYDPLPDGAICSTQKNGVCENGICQPGPENFDCHECSSVTISCDSPAGTGSWDSTDCTIELDQEACKDMGWYHGQEIPLDLLAQFPACNSKNAIGCCLAKHEVTHALDTACSNPPHDDSPGMCSEPHAYEVQQECLRDNFPPECLGRNSARTQSSPAPSETATITPKPTPSEPCSSHCQALAYASLGGYITNCLCKRWQNVGLGSALDCRACVAECVNVAGESLQRSLPPTCPWISDSVIMEACAGGADVYCPPFLPEDLWPAPSPTTSASLHYRL